MGSEYFRFKQFSIQQQGAAMKIGLDSVFLGAWVNVKEPNFALDIGTGTGLLALMLAQKYQGCQIDAVELDKKAFDVASINIEQSVFCDRIQLFHNSIQNFSVTCEKRYDLIISNPPYFTESIKPKNTSRTLARHHDFLPLKSFFEVSSKLLSSTGHFYFIYPAKEFETINMELDKVDLFLQEVIFVADNKNKPAKRVVCKVGKEKIEMRTENFFYRDEKGYSTAFRELTTDYYLHLK